MLYGSDNSEKVYNILIGKIEETSDEYEGLLFNPQQVHKDDDAAQIHSNFLEKVIESETIELISIQGLYGLGRSICKEFGLKSGIGMGAIASFMLNKKQKEDLVDALKSNPQKFYKSTETDYTHW